MEVPYVIVAVILMIIIIVVVLFLLLSGGFDQTEETINFRQFCLYWSLHRYREEFGDTIQVGNYSVNVENQCRTELGKPIEFFSELDAQDLENCRNACRLVRNEPVS